MPWQNLGATANPLQVQLPERYLEFHRFPLSNTQYIRPHVPYGSYGDDDPPGSPATAGHPSLCHGGQTFLIVYHVTRNRH